MGWKCLGILAAAVAGAASMMAAGPPAMAQASCDIERFAGPPDGCQREKITASGRQRPFENAFPSARVSARKAWERQVLTKFGERFKIWDHAQCATTECVPGSISGMKRCTFSGYPCVSGPALASETESGKSGPLERAEIVEMQELLIRAGITRVRVGGKLRKVYADGQFGDITAAAIGEFIERYDIDDSKLSDRDVLGLLRKRFG